MSIFLTKTIQRWKNPQIFVSGGNCGQNEDFFLVKKNPKIPKKNTKRHRKLPKLKKFVCPPRINGKRTQDREKVLHTRELGPILWFLRRHVTSDPGLILARTLKDQKI